MLKRHEARGCDKWNRRRRHAVVKWGFKRGNVCVVRTHSQTGLILDDGRPSHVVVVVHRISRMWKHESKGNLFVAKQ